MSIQEMDRLPSPPKGATYFEETCKPTVSMIRALRRIVCPNLINLSEVTSNTVLKQLLGEWIAEYSSTADVAFCRPTFIVTAFGKPVPGVTVSLFSGDTLVGEATTDENGEATFDLSFSEPGAYNYVAVIGKTKPLIIAGNPRAYSFRISVWFVYTRSSNLTDVWARLQGRSFFRPLPVYFWTEMPSSVVGLAGRNVGYVDLVPCIDGQTIPLEIGVSAYCNTPEPYPSAEKCCEYAKNTWWRLDVYATNDPEKVSETFEGSNHIGGDKVNLDYHLKYSISSSSVTYRGRYLKQVRCPWEEGTAPMDP